MSPLHHNCAGVSRRDFLQIGLGGTLGLGLCDLLRARAMAAPTAAPAKNVNCIMIWMDGGPSHYETFDPKPDAPAEIRGTFKTIPTCVPGVHFSEPVPELAKAFNKFTVIRSIAHKDPNQGGGGNHYMTRSSRGTTMRKVRVIRSSRGPRRAMASSSSRSATSPTTAATTTFIDSRWPRQSRRLRPPRPIIRSL